MPLLCHCAALAVRRGLPSPSWRSAHISSARAPSSAFARVSKCYSTPIGVKTPPKRNRSVASSAPAAPPNLPPPRPTGARQWADIAPFAGQQRDAPRAARGCSDPPLCTTDPSPAACSPICRRRALPAPDIAPRRAAAGRAARSAGRRHYLSLRKQSVARRTPPNLPPPRPTGAHHWAKVTKGGARLPLPAASRPTRPYG
jgi:hypothetical protein